MAANEINLTLKITEKGNLKVVGQKAEKAAAGLDKTAKSARTADRNLKGASQQSANGTKNFSKMAQGISGTLVPAYATLAANVFAITAAFSFLKTAADFRVVTESQIAFASATGIGVRSITKDIQQASDGLVSFTDAASAAAIGVASGLSPDQLRGFAAGAKNVSVILGRDVTDSFNRLIRGVTKAEPELLDELGIILRLTTATENYAGQLNKSVKDLTLFEKSQAVAVEVQSQLDKKYGAVAAAVELQGNSIAKLGIAFEKVLNPIKEFISVLAEPTAEFFTRNIGSLAAALALIALPITKAILPSLDEWAKKSKTSAYRIKKELVETRKEIEELEIAQARLRAAGKDPAQMAAQAVEGVQSKASGIVKLQQGKYTELTKREISSLLIQAKKGQGAVTQMSKKMQAQYIASLKTMKGQSTSTFSAIQNGFARMYTFVQVETKRMQARWEVAMLRMKQATSLFVKGVNKLMKAMGIVGVALLLKDLAVEGAKAMGFLSDTQADLDKAEALETLAERLKNTTKEFSKFAEIQSEFAKTDQGFTLESLNALSNFIGTQGSVFADITTEYKALKDVVGEESIGGDVRSMVGMVDLSEQLSELMENSAESAAGFVQALKAANIQAQPLGSELLNIAEKMAGEGGLANLSEKDLDRFQELLKYFTELGQKTTILQQKEQGINEQYRRRVSSITQFSTSVTSLITEIEKTLELESEVTTNNAARVESYKQQLAFLQQIRDVEIERVLATKRLKLEEEKGKRFNLGGFSVGATSGIAEEQARRRAVSAAQIALEDAERQLGFAEDGQTEADAKKLQELELNVQLATEALKNLNAELDFGNRLVTGIADSFESSFATAFEGIITGTMSVKDAFLSMGKSILSMIAKMIAQMIAFKIVSSIMGAFGFGSAQAAGQVSQYGVAGGMPAPVTPLGGGGGPRYGGMFEPAPGYRDGGLARGRHAGYPAILHGTEAVVPLPNGNSIPVELKNGGSQNNNVVVNVSVDSDGQASQNMQSDGQQGANLGKAIAAAVQQEIMNQRRNGGMLSPYGAS